MWPSPRWAWFVKSPMVMKAQFCEQQTVTPRQGVGHCARHPLCSACLSLNPPDWAVAGNSCTGIPGCCHETSPIPWQTIGARRMVSTGRRRFTLPNVLTQLPPGWHTSKEGGGLHRITCSLPVAGTCCRRHFCTGSPGRGGVVRQPRLEPWHLELGARSETDAFAKSPKCTQDRNDDRSIQKNGTDSGTFPWMQILLFPPFGWNEGGFAWTGTHPPTHPPIIKWPLRPMISIMAIIS